MGHLKLKLVVALPRENVTPLSAPVALMLAESVLVALVSSRSAVWYGYAKVSITKPVYVPWALGFFTFERVTTCEVPAETAAPFPLR